MKASRPVDTYTILRLELPFVIFMSNNSLGKKHRYSLLHKLKKWSKGHCCVTFGGEWCTLTVFNHKMAAKHKIPASVLLLTSGYFYIKATKSVYFSP